MFKLLLISAVLGALPPALRVVTTLPLPFLKMTTSQTERAIAMTHTLWGAQGGPERDVRCEAATLGWDYICTLNAEPTSSSRKRVKIGVQVGFNSVRRVSGRYDLDKHIQAAPPDPPMRPRRWTFLY